MKTKAIKLISLITALLVAVALTVGYVFAWILDRKNADLSLIGSSAGAYFDSTSGDGTAVGKEFIISNPTHLRNLAILQNTGRFEGKKYYFKIKDSVNSIDMSGIYIPPIGNDKDPFIGDFNGNGKTLANLKVTTDKTLLGSEYPTQSSAEYAFSQAVGLFGMTGNADGKNAKESTDICNIRNFILENPTVDVSGANTKYLTEATAPEGVTPAKQVAGIAVGHVAGKCSSIGVKSDTGDGAALNVQVSGYSTFNSILGNLGEGVESSVTGGGHVAGSTDNVGYGGSLNFLEMMRRITLMRNANWSTPSLNEYGGLTSNKSTQFNKYQFIPLVVSNQVATNVADDTYYKNNTAEQIPETNIGYFMGAEAKITPRNRSVFSDTNVYTAALNENSALYRKSVTLDGDIKTDLDDMLAQNYLYGARFNNQIDINSFVKIQQANIVGHVGKTITVPMHTVWFAAQSTGMAKFIFSAQNDTLTRGVSVYHIIRNNTSSDNLFYTPLTNEKSNSSVGYGSATSYGGVDGSSVKIELIENAYKDINSDGTISYSYSNTKPSESSELVYSYGWYNNQTLTNANALYYTEIPIIEGNEYALGENADGGTWIIYMDIGQNAAADTSAIAPEKEVSAVDFIYDGVRIAQDGDTLDTGLLTGDFIVKPSGETWTKYESSKTSVYFENIKNALKIVFLRLYSGSTSHTDKTKTICLEQSTPVPNNGKDCEVYATYTTYVCPNIKGGSGTVSGGGGTGGGNTGTGGDETVSVTGVTISYNDTVVTAGTTLSLEKDKSITLIATVTPNNASNKEVTWSSSAPTVATVDAEGNVTAVGNGEATITVAAAGGEKTATCKVTVTGFGGGETPATSATIDLSTHPTSGKTLGLSAKIGDKEYFKITSTENYKYVSNNSTVGGPVIVSSNNNRPMTISIGEGVTEYETVEITLKIAIAQKEALASGSTGTVTTTNGAKVLFNGSEISSITTTDGNTVVELKITLKGVGASVTIGNETGRIALISASGVIA